MSRSAAVWGLIKSWPIVACSGVGAVFGGHLVIRSYAGGKHYKVPEDVVLEGKTYIVTGANTGIGFETAKALARKKARVIMACRDMDKCTEKRRDIVLETRSKDIVCRECDLASIQSIRNCAEKILRREKRIDGLINNAAVMRLPGRELTSEGIEKQFGVNHLGHFLLTMLLLDKMKSQDHSCRILHLGSMAHVRAVINFDDLNSSDYDCDHAYQQSKLAQFIFSNELTTKLKGTNVTSNVVEPGVFVKTELDRYMPWHRTWYNFISKPSMAYLSFFKKRTAEQAAWYVMHAITEPELEGVSGIYLRNYERDDKHVNPDGFNPKLGLRLWATSEKWSRLREQKKLLELELKEPIKKREAKDTLEMLNIGESRLKE